MARKKRERTRLKDEKTVGLAEAVPFLLLPRQRLLNDRDRFVGPSGVPRQLCAVEDPQRAVREPRMDSIEDGAHRAEVTGFGRLPAGHEEEEAVKSREGQRGKVAVNVVTGCDGISIRSVLR